MQRIFIAVKITPETQFVKQINNLKTGLVSENIKWTDIQNIHLTLVFLGETVSTSVKRIQDMLFEKCPAISEFDFVIRKLGLFKSLNDPRVLWAGLENTESLKQLHSVIVTGLKDSGYNPEERKFSPHITLGRIKSINRKEILEGLLQNYSDYEFQKVHVKEVILYESILSYKGPVYKPLAVIPLRS
jgi:RNA 2',3'-cyclic 3'-phosphodiesterase